MGKRELLIALGFVVAGVVAWQFTAPPSGGSGGFSLRDLWNKAREEIRADSERATVRTPGTIALGVAVTELRLRELPRGTKILAESRDDIAYELTVESTGPTPEQARAWAGQITLSRDELGETLTLWIDNVPRGGVQRPQVVLRVPDRLAVRLQGMRAVEAVGLASLHLDGVSGDTTLRDTRGAVIGMHSAGDLTVSGAAAVKLTLQPASDARLERVAGPITIDARNGEVAIADTTGPLEITGLNEVITIARHTGSIRVGGSGGRVEVDGPTEDSRIDMRRAEIEATLRAAVPLALLTTDEAVTLTLDGPPAIALDAVATEGRIDAAALALQPQDSGADMRLSHLFAPGAAVRVSIRNLRGDIVIGKSK
jgi:hypothetical protein